MKFLIPLVFFFGNVSLVSAQSDSINVEEKYFAFINYEVIPKYRLGSNEDLMEDIYKKINYSRAEVYDKETELIVLKVEVNKFGKVDCPEILIGDFPEAEMQLLNLIWDYEFEPGTFRGVPVKVYMNFPFRFKKNKK